jgi:hypothetical protein
MDTKPVRVLLIILFVVPCSIALISLLSGFLSIGVQELYWRAKANDVDNHAQWWREQKIIKYKMGIRWFGLSTGSQELVINDKKVEQMRTNNCNNCSSTTIEDLFAFVENLNKARHCGANGCECDGPFIMDVVYDTKYSFPQKANPTYDSMALWMYRIDLMKPGKGFCTMLGNLGIGWEVFSFTPMQQEP